MKNFSSTSSSEEETNERSVKRMAKVNLLSNETISSSSSNDEDTDDRDTDDEATDDEDYHQ